MLAVGNVGRTEDAVWKAMLSAQQGPTELALPALADGDPEPDVPDLGPEPGPGLDGPEPGDAPLAVAPARGRGRGIVGRGVRGRGGRALAVPAAPRIAVELGPMRFAFPCGDGMIEVKLDGFSHTSGIRRAYAQCRCDGHEKCFKYTQLNIWPAPWMGVAYVLLYMRRGVGLPDKIAHTIIDDPTVAELALLEVEMPDILRAADFPCVA